MTEEEIIAFQKDPSHTDWFGVPLQPDGDLGRRTRWAMDIATLPLWRQQIIRATLIEYAKGVVEIPRGSNRGEHIDKYIRWCGLDPNACSKTVGFRWCAASAAYALSGGSPKAIRIAGVKNLAESLYPTNDPLPADLAYSLRPDGTGHCGVLLGLDISDAMINEGNSNHKMEIVCRSRNTLRFASVHPPQRIAAIGAGIPRAGTNSVTT